MKSGRQEYRLYGLSLSTDLELPCPRAAPETKPDVRLVPWRFTRDEATRGARRARVRDWFLHQRLPDDSRYLRWTDLFEFLVSRDGRTIRYHRLEQAGHESFATYLLGQVLSFSLLARREEPLHATVVVHRGAAIGFLGACGAGKSTLGAAFLAAGDRILTDDLLATRETSAGYLAQPGVPRIKLFPGVARSVLGDAEGEAMNPATPKRVLALDRERVVRRPVKLAALYVLKPAGRRSGIRIQPLSEGEALLELLANSFNTIVDDQDRLTHQFRYLARLAQRVPVRSLRYARRLGSLPEVRRAVLADAVR